MKKAILIGVVLVLMLFLLPSCATGVPQEEYDRVSSDLATAQTEIQSLEGKLSTKEAELSAKESELEATKGKLEQGKAKIEILNAIFIPAMTGELDRMTEAESVKFFFEWGGKIKDVGDPMLTAKFEALIETFSDEALLSFFVYLLESTADASQ